MKNNHNTDKNLQLFLARYLTFKFASECVTMMEEAKGHMADIGIAYQFFASNALELFAKSFMCLRWEKEDGLNIEEINKRASSFGHDLDRIYHYQGVGEDFLFVAGIKKVTLFKQKGNINHHYFKFYINDGAVIVYPVESLRYGILTIKKNDFIVVKQMELLNLCKSVRIALETKAKQFIK